MVVNPHPSTLRRRVMSNVSEFSYNGSEDDTDADLFESGSELVYETVDCDMTISLSKTSVAR